MTRFILISLLFLTNCVQATDAIDPLQQAIEIAEQRVDYNRTALSILDGTVGEDPEMSLRFAENFCAHTLQTRLQEDPRGPKPSNGPKLKALKIENVKKDYIKNAKGIILHGYLFWNYIAKSLRTMAHEPTDSKYLQSFIREIWQSGKDAMAEYIDSADCQSRPYTTTEYYSYLMLVDTLRLYTKRNLLEDILFPCEIFEHEMNEGEDYYCRMWSDPNGIPMKYRCRMWSAPNENTQEDKSFSRPYLDTNKLDITLGETSFYTKVFKRTILDQKGDHGSPISISPEEMELLESFERRDQYDVNLQTLFKSQSKPKKASSASNSSEDKGFLVLPNQSRSKKKSNKKGKKKGNKRGNAKKKGNARSPKKSHPASMLPPKKSRVMDPLDAFLATDETPQVVEAPEVIALPSSLKKAPPSLMLEEEVDVLSPVNLRSWEAYNITGNAKYKREMERQRRIALKKVGSSTGAQELPKTSAEELRLLLTLCGPLSGSKSICWDEMTSRLTGFGWDIVENITGGSSTSFFVPQWCTTYMQELEFPVIKRFAVHKAHDTSESPMPKYIFRFLTSGLERAGLNIEMLKVLLSKFND